MLDPQVMLAPELKTFEEHKEELLLRYEGKYVLVKGNSILGSFDTKLEAVAAGHDRVGAEPFLVKKVEKTETPVRILGS